MDFHIPAEIKTLKRSVRQFVEAELRPLEQQVEREGVSKELGRTLIKKAVDLGIYALAMPKEFGGGGVGLLGQVVVAEEMGRVHPALRFVVSDGDQIVLNWGTPEQKQKYLVPLVRGEKRPAIAMTEAASGSDTDAITTTATRDANGWVINGGKIFTSYGDKATYVRVFAITDPQKRSSGGMTCFLVDTDNPGFRVERVLDTIAEHSLGLCELKFDDCRVSEDAVLGSVGNGMQVFGTTYAANRGRYGGSCVGVAEFLLEKMRDHANSRVVFGRPIAERQAVQWWLADTAIDIYATRMMTYNFAWRYDQGLDVRHESSIVKTFAVEMVGRAADRAIQLHGGMGLTKDLPFERIYREVRGLRIAGGTTEIQRVIIARNILRGNAGIGYDI